jgi:hypothetical protein
MAGWPGWVGDILDAGGWPKTDDNKQFLSNWGLYEQSGCDNNPLLASRSASSSTDCKKLNDARTAQNYTTRTQAVNATVAQIKSGNFDNIEQALKDGNPFHSQHENAIALDLQKWGADNYSRVYAQAVGAGTGVGGGGSAGTGKKPHAQGAWTRWMHAMAHQLPADIREINKATARLNRIARNR